jgi:bifunctional UDP-N-acetylglucosamine pyrophosphorylase/glucosamine-1-phosphate N-acetyltransferase
MTRQPVLIVLAGGASSRLWPLSDKTLLKLAYSPGAGRLLSLMERHLTTLNQLGFEEGVVVANLENQETMRAALKDARFPVEVVVQQEPRGIGDALLQVEDYLKARDYPPFYMAQAHDVTEETLHREILEAYRAGRAEAFLAGYQVSEYFPGGYLTVGADGRITDIIEKPGAGNEPSDLVNFMAHLHTRPKDLLEKIRRLYESGHTRDDHYEVAMGQQMAESRYEVVRYNGIWRAVKYPWHVLDVANFFLGRIEGQHISPDARVADSAMISGDVVIEAGARVFHTASIVGPAYIGPGTIVGNGALVRESMISGNCAVGHVSEVARSYLADGCQLHRAVVLDSVFDENVNFSAGCVTANLRWDRGAVKSTVKGERMDTGRDKLGLIAGRDAFIGIKAGTMPGVKVGQRAVVGPMTNATHDVPDDTLLYAEAPTVQKPIAGEP